jgi:hypothetical protein
LRLIPKLLPVNDRQVHSATRQRIVPAKKIRTDKWRMHHAPRKYPPVEFGWGKRPSPSAHDHERTDTVGIGESKTETGWAAPIVANDGCVANVELSQQARQICDVAIKAMRLFANRLFGEAKPDHVGDDNPPSRCGQRLYEFPIEEPPGGIAMQENDWVAGSFIDVMHAPAVDALEPRFVRPFLVDKVPRLHGLPCYVDLHSFSPGERLSSWKEHRGLPAQAG